MAVAVKKMTNQEFRQLEFDDNAPFLYELINGELVKKLAPNPEHPEISGLLYNKMSAVVTEKNWEKLIIPQLTFFR